MSALATTAPETRISPARTSAMAFALVLHVGAFALLIAPVRAPDTAPNVVADPIEVLIRERPIDPPPPAPLVPLQTPKLTAAPTHRAPPLPAAIPNPLPAASLAELVTDTAPTLPTLPQTAIGDSEAFTPEQIGAASYLEAPPPRYPTAAIRKGWQGEVLLLVTIGVDGRPEAVQVQHGSGHGVLDRSAIEQVQRRWRFRPSIENGLPVRSRALVPIYFSLAQG